MSWQLIVNDLSRALVASPQVTATDVAASLGVLGVVVAALWGHAMVFRDVEAPVYERLAHEQGGLLFGKSVMRAGYWLLQPIGSRLQRRGIRPSSVTITGLICAAVAAAAILCGRFGLAGLVLLCAALCDALDGMVARLGKETSESGAAMDAIVDRMQEILVLSAVALANHRVSWLAALSMGALISSLMNSYVSAKAEVYRIQIPSGRMRRGERSAWLVLGCLLVPLTQAVTPLTHLHFGALPLALSLLVVAVGAGVSSTARALALVTSLRTRTATLELQSEHRRQTTSRGADLRSLGEGIETWLIESTIRPAPIPMDAGRGESGRR